MRLATRQRRLALALVAGAVVLPPAGDAAWAAGGLRRVVVPRDAAAPPAAVPVSSVRVGGQELPVIEAAPVSGWTLVVAVDPALSGPESGERAAALLGPAAGRLVALGVVRLLVVETLVEQRLAPTRDAAALERALAALGRGGGWGEVLSRRQQAGADADRSERVEAARDELQLVRWQREALVDWLLEADLEGPKAVLLLQDAWDPRQHEAYGLTSDPGPLPPSPVLDDELLGRTLAAAGWVVLPLALAEPAETVRTAAGQATLAAQTGGRVVRSAEDLGTALDSLAGALSVAFELGPVPAWPLTFEVLPAGGGLTAPAWVGGAFLPGRAAARARRFLSEEATGGLAVEAAISYEGPDEQSVVLEVRTALAPPGSPPDSAWLTLALYLDQVDAPPLELEIQGGGASLAGVDRWVTQTALELPPDAGELVAVVTDGASGRWGAARVEEEAPRLAQAGPGVAIEQYDLRPRREPRPEPETPTVIKLLAPTGAELAGQQRFRTLVTSEIVERVVFWLDDEAVATDDEAPYAARIDLGRAAARHTVRADAFDVMGNLLGSDSIRLNEPARSFDVTLTDVSLDRPPGLVLAAEVAHPTDVGVERLEFYLNEELLATVEAPPWTAAASVAPRGETDYVRVVAYFADGRFLEDVRLLSSLGTAEEVEVNLVQVYVVATDKQGRPVEDLTAEDFEIRLGGERQAIERFAYADQVPLLLSLVIDTSGSMLALMPDTKKAAGRFLTQVLTEHDRALVVDFDDRPRVAAPLSDDIGDLLRSLGSLVAEENALTALFDSVIFGALELPSGQHRKAVVLLTDGDDTKSRFSLGRAIDTAKQAGVPVYVVSLAAVHDPRRRGVRTDIEALTAQTGGEAFYLGAMSELTATYDAIARELRSQYMLAFPTARQLSERDLASIRVAISRPGIELRTVVGGRSVD